MGSAHIIYIPVVLLAGVVIGLIIARATGSMGASDAERRREKRAERVEELKARLKADGDEG